MRIKHCLLAGVLFFTAFCQSVLAGKQIFRAEVSATVCHGLFCTTERNIKATATWIGHFVSGHRFNIHLFPGQTLKSAHIFHSGKWHNATIVNSHTVSTPTISTPTATQKKGGVQNLDALRAQIDTLKLDLAQLRAQSAGNSRAITFLKNIKRPIEHWNVATGKLIRRNEYKLGETIKFGKLPFTSSSTARKKGESPGS